jgi:RNA polymerase sigma-B factor
VLLQLDTPVAEKHLFARRDTDPLAREQLINMKLPLAWAMARRYPANARVESDDIRQAAALGLVKAVDRFDPERGASFSSFAVPTITGEIRRFIRDTAWAVHVTRDLQEAALAVTRAVDTLSTELGRSPTTAEIAATTGRSREAVLEAIGVDRAWSVKSLDGTDGDADALTPHDRIGDHDGRFESWEDRHVAQNILAKLSDHERRLLRMRFVDGLTQREIGEQLGVSQMQISRLLRRALERASILAAGMPRLSGDESATRQ